MITLTGNHARCDMSLVENMRLAHIQSTEALDQGSVGILGDYVANEREVRTLVKPTTALITAGIDKENLVVVCAPELIYDESKLANNQLKNFYNEANVATRAYRLSTIRKFRLSKEGFTNALESDLTVGKYVDLTDASFELTASASKTDATIGKIVRIDNEGIATYVDSQGALLGNVYKMYVIEVL